MGREINLAGFRLTLDEWEALGADDRQSLLQVFGAAVTHDAIEQAYDSYEVSWNSLGLVAG
jgi:hypothetical protein